MLLPYNTYAIGRGCMLIVFFSFALFHAPSTNDDDVVVNAKAKRKNERTKKKSNRKLIIVL